MIRLHSPNPERGTQSVRFSWTRRHIFLHTEEIRHYEKRTPHFPVPITDQVEGNNFCNSEQTKREVYGVKEEPWESRGPGGRRRRSEWEVEVVGTEGFGLEDRPCEGSGQKRKGSQPRTRWSEVGTRVVKGWVTLKIKTYTKIDEKCWRPETRGEECKHGSRTKVHPDPTETS